MQVSLHKNATTTPKIRQAIQQSDQSIASRYTTAKAPSMPGDFLDMYASRQHFISARY